MSFSTIGIGSAKKPISTKKPALAKKPVSAKKPQKRKYVITHELQKKQKFTIKSPELGKRMNLRSSQDLLTIQQDASVLKAKWAVRRKIDLHNDSIGGDRSEENDFITELVGQLKAPAAQKGKGKEKAQEECDDYIPENEEENDSDDTSKKIWDYTRDHYIIPDNGHHWVDKTISTSWRVYKSRVKKKKKGNPDLGSSSDAQVYLNSHKREECRIYKTNTTEIKKRIIEIKKKVATGEDASELIVNDKSHGREWPQGRHGKTASLASASAPVDDTFLDDVTEKIKRDLEVELEANVNKKVQDNMMLLLKKLAEANPGLNLDIADYCATVPSEDDENATPFTVGTST
ncbi:hypothetical protein POM88_027434 [Heracleum sosnowskyi]|uniref:Uncharacterized protein n=1 Tax=Heracleum sosnowskyi TaxID=360622 RepID=A0AAD8I8F6_9APIA|nr:hypothetical protein POM88_027434 [Heracleum sosnowskyi]